MQKYCRHTTQLGRGVGGRVNMECRIDQEEGLRRNTVHTFTYCFLTSSCAAANEWVQCEGTGSEQGDVVWKNEVMEADSETEI